MCIRSSDGEIDVFLRGIVIGDRELSIGQISALPTVARNALNSSS